MAAKKDVKKEAVVDAVAETAAAPSLTINDLQLFAQIVDLASQRGAFKAAELEQVGAAYNKLATFLKSVTDAQAAEAATKEEAAPAV